MTRTFISGTDFQFCGGGARTFSEVLHLLQPNHIREHERSVLAFLEEQVFPENNFKSYHQQHGGDNENRNEEFQSATATDKQIKRQHRVRFSEVKNATHTETIENMLHV